jgi:hypothetical protein
MRLLRAEPVHPTSMPVSRLFDDFPTIDRPSIRALNGALF